MNKNTLRRTTSGVAMLAIGGLVALTTGIGSASAVAGESSKSSGRYLSGSLFSGTLTPVIALGGSSATNNGVAADDIEENNIDLSLLSSLGVSTPTGLSIPLSIADAGVLGQYARANSDGSSIGAAGLVANNGTIGTGNVPPGSVPGPLSFDLSDAVGNTGLGSALTSEIANLSLDVGAVSSRAALNGPPTQRSYEITNLGLKFKSAAVGSLVSRLNTQLATLQTTSNGLSAGLKVALGGPLATVNVSTVNLAGAVAADLTGTRSANGVTIDLATGNITVDLSQFAALNGQAPNTNILTTAEIAAISTAITGLVNSIVAKVGTDAQAALNGITITGGIVAPITATPLVSINTSVGQILAGSSSGITILGGLSTPASVLGLLAPVVAPLGGVASTLNTAVAVPVNALVSPAVTQVLGAVLRLTANAQSSTAGVDSVTALRIGLLTGLSKAAVADLATSTVGPNVQIPNPTITGISPTHGTESGGTVVTLTGTGLDTVTSVTIGGNTAVPTAATATSLTFTTPAHAAGPVTVTANAPQGNSGTLAYTYDGVASTTSSLAPNTGPDTGGTSVIITGTNMNDASGVTFGGVAGTGFAVIDATHASVVTPAHATGTVPVVLGNLAGNGTGLSFTFTGTPSDASSITPDSGPETGGTVVTILGSGFTGATGVTFDGIAATSVLVVDGGTVTAIAPAHVAGAVDVVVQDPAGDSDPLTYTYLGVPSITALMVPILGPDTGGTTVTLTGTGFLGATGVTFGGTAGTSFTVVSPTRITVVTPAHAAGLVNVVVQDPTGDASPLPFTFTPIASTAGSLTPTHGTQAGGTTVTITGTGLADATGVRFGGVLGTDYTVISPTQATVVTPAHAPGAASVVVVNPSGNSASLSYTFDAISADAAALTPNSGPETGGTAVTVTGTGFLGATSVTFDGTVGTAFTVVDDTTITVTAPAHVAGAVDVVVTDPAGDSDPLTFTYTPVAADASSLTPSSGTVAGGTTVTITGTGFLGATGVTFGGTAALDFTIVSPTTITVTTPEHVAPGAVDVVVEDPARDSDPLTFTYAAMAAHLTSLAPVSGSQAGGTTVTITGTGLLGSTGATFGLTPGTGYTVIDDTTATVVTPAHALGLVAVSVQDPAGNATGLGYTFVNVPSVATSLLPVSGTQAGGTSITITGSGLLSATAVRFAGISGTGFTVVNDTTITVKSPAHALGQVSVVVVDAAGNAAPLAYTYVNTEASATTISPTSGPDTGGTAVTITGTGFLGATGVTFDGTPATDFTVVNDTTITATTPPGAAGTADVVVTDPAGDSDPIDFDYTPGATITDLTPSLVPEAGGTTITITGTCFTGATAVMFGDVTVTDFTVNAGGTVITVVAPAGSGLVDVTVVGAASCGTAVLANGLGYIAAASVAVLLSPGRGPETGHTLVTITGHGFIGATGVTFDGVLGTSFTVVDDDTITVRTPVHDPGDVDVIVLDPASDSPLLQFTYTPVSNGNGSAPGGGDGNGSGDGTSTAGGPLAFTGIDGATTLIAAAVLLLSGALLLVIRLRRRKSDSIG